jgi:hypothetical protein
MYNMVLYYYVLIVFSLHRESLKLILATDPLPRWFCHRLLLRGAQERRGAAAMVKAEAGKLHARRHMICGLWMLDLFLVRSPVVVG